MALDTVLLSAIASPRRREILRLLWNEELSAGAINAAFPDVTFGAVSMQLRALARAGLVTVRPAGRHRYYRVQRERLGPVGALLEQMWADALWRLKLEAEFESTRRGPRPRQTVNRRQAGLPDTAARPAQGAGRAKETH